jgi:Mg-chelatase subunit ChlD
MEVVSLKPLLWLLALLPLLGILRLSLVDRPRPYHLAAAGLRIMAIVLLALALCQPFVTSRSRDLHVVFILDVSESVDLRAARQALDTIDRCIGQLKASDSWSLLLVGDGVRPCARTQEAAAQLDAWLQSMPDHRFRGATRLADALRSTRLCFPADKARRVVLLTDGRPTHDPVDPALACLAEEHVDLRICRLPGLKAPEACVESLQPSTAAAFEGETVRMNAKVTSNRRMAATLRILSRGVVYCSRRLDLDPDHEQTVPVDLPMDTPGVTHWTAELEAEQDHFPMNNQARCTVRVQGRPRLLVLHQTPRQMNAFSKAMAEQGLEVEVRGSQGMPEDLASLLAFDAVILADLPAMDLSGRQMEMLKRYVADFGGGLAMFGSDNSFGPGGYYGTAVDEVLPLSSRYEKEKQQPSVAMVLVIDKSGSMTGMPVALARQAARATVDLLGPQDHIGVVAFDGRTSIVSPLCSTSQATQVKDAIQSIASGGGTSMYPAVQAAFKLLEVAQAKIKHVIVLSDGQSQPADHLGLVAEMARAGVTVSTVALGQADRPLLSSMADAGKGRFYETTDPSHIPLIFTKETLEISRTAVKEDVFTLVQTSDHTLLSGFSGPDLPAILGYVMTRVKPATQLLLASHSGDPVLAVSRYGLGSTLAYTSDLTDKWGAQWLTWEPFGRFWAQALRGIVRRESAEGLTVQQTADSRRWTVDLLSQDAAGNPMSGAHFEAQTVDDSQTVAKVAVEEVGLGRYRLAVPIDQAESLSLRISDPNHDRTAILHYDRPYPEEYRLSSQMAAGLKDIPPLDASRIREDLIPVKTRRPITALCCLLSLACLLAGLTLRRI